MDVAITLDQDDWNALRADVKDAGAKSRVAQAKWMAIAGKAVAGKAVIYWRGLLADLKDRCEKDADADCECPYGLQYLYEFAIAYNKMKTAKRDFKDYPNIPTSVFRIGRDMDDLFDLLDENPNMTVSRIKAIIKLRHDNPRGTLDSEEEDRKLQAIEEEQARKRKKPKNKRGERIYETAEEFIDDLEAKMDGLSNALVRLVARGVEFDEEITVAYRKVQRFANDLAEVEPTPAGTA